MKHLFTAFCKKSFFILLLLDFSFYSFASSPIDFNINAAQNIDTRIATKHATVNKPIFSLQNHISGIYTRNTNCWAADLDLTCASPWNSRGGALQAGTLITPRHCILAAHFNLKAGDSIRFVTKDNVTVRRKIIAHKVNTDFTTNTPDIEVITLDSDVPATITPCQFLPASYASYLSNDGDGLPVLYTDQEEKALVADIWDINSSKFFDLQVPVTSNRLALNESIITGDSGDPIFLILNGKPVIIGCFTWGGAGSGNSLTYYANLANGGTQPSQNINDLIVATDAIASINTGYKISFFDFITTATHKIENSISARVFTTGRTLNVVFQSETADYQVQICDLIGKVISTQNVSSLDFNYELPTNGIYIVTISSGSAIQSFKVVSH